MKRLTFLSPEELIDHCQREQVTLIVEYTDVERKQRQVTLTGNAIREAAAYLEKKNAMAYFRKDGIFYEVKPGWLNAMQ